MYIKHPVTVKSKSDFNFFNVRYKNINPSERKTKFTRFNEVSGANGNLDDKNGTSILYEYGGVIFSSPLPVLRYSM